MDLSLRRRFRRRLGSFVQAPPSTLTPGSADGTGSNKVPLEGVVEGAGAGEGEAIGSGKKMVSLSPEELINSANLKHVSITSLEL